MYGILFILNIEVYSGRRRNKFHAQKSAQSNSGHLDWVL